METDFAAQPPWPDEFTQRLRQILPETSFDTVARNLSTRRQLSFRVNTLVAAVEAVINALREDGIDPQPVAWCDHAFFVDEQSRARLTRSPPAVEGAIYVQNLSSILATLILDPRPGESVLDLASAPGGKAAHMAARMNNQGRLSVVEPIRKRMFVLAANLRKAGVTIAKTYLMDGRKVGGKTPGRFDRVLLDAPCSGEARFDAGDPSTWEFWSLRKIAEQARKQVGLIQSAFEALRPGGRMLYCTCSFAPEENEAIVDSLLKKFPHSASLVPASLPVVNVQPGLTAFDGEIFDESLRLTQRILPNGAHEAFFMALIGKE
jgi:16S rRNA C967 or C1407 C5-methylase (RsmB/RsmF family)